MTIGQQTTRLYITLYENKLDFFFTISTITLIQIQINTTPTNHSSPPSPSLPLSLLPSKPCFFNKFWVSAVTICCWAALFGSVNENRPCPKVRSQAGNRMYLRLALLSWGSGPPVTYGACCRDVF